MRTSSPDVEVFSSTSLNEKTTDKKKTKSKGKERAINPFKLTSRVFVDHLLTVTSLPSTWAVPHDNSATLVDLSAIDTFPRRQNGQEYSIDGYVRAEVRIWHSLVINKCPHSSWGFIRIKIHGVDLQVMLPEKLMFLVFMKILTVLSGAVELAWNAMASTHASTSMKTSFRTASGLSQTRKKCENFGTMSLMLAPEKLVLKEILSRGNSDSLNSASKRIIYMYINHLSL